MYHFKNFRNILLFISLCIIGGTTYAFQKLGLANGLPLWSAGIRFLIAGLVMGSYTIATKKFVCTKKTITTGFQYGLLYFGIPFGIIYWVGQFLPSSLLSVLSASVSVFAILFSMLLYKERTTKVQVYGIILSACGIALIFLQSIFSSYDIHMLFYLIICLIAYMGAAYSTAFLKSRISQIDQVSFNVTALVIGGSILCIGSLILETGNRYFYGNALIALLYLAVFGSMVSTRITTFLMKEWNVAKVTTYRFISPVISLVVGMLFWNELLRFNEILGSIFIVLGVIVINKANLGQLN